MKLNNETTVIIPCAGKGTRMYNETKRLIPKSMLEIENKPILYWIVNNLRKQGFSKFIIVINELGDIIVDFLTKEFPNEDIDFVVQDNAFGPLYAIYIAQNKVKTSNQLIFLGDTLCFDDLNLESDFILYSIVVKDYNKWCLIDTGNSEIVITFLDKPTANVNTNKAIIGVYYISNSIFWQKCIQFVINENIVINGEFQISSALHIYNQNYPFKAKICKEWFDCGSPDSYFYTKNKLENENI